MKNYTTAQGDMWDSIAYSQLGSCAYTDRLISANMAFRETYIFPAGIVLVIPDVDTTDADDTQPPWREVRG